MSTVVPESGALRAERSERTERKSPTLMPDLRHRLQESFGARMRTRLVERLRGRGHGKDDGAAPQSARRDAGDGPGHTVRVDADGSPDEARRRALRAAELVADRPRVERIVVSGRHAGTVRPFLAETARASGCRLFQARSGDEIGSARENGSSPDTVRLVDRPPVWQLAAKRIIDLVGAAAGLVLLSPLFLFVGLGIKLSSSGPVFFRQRRVGMAGREYRIFKFRTMKVDSEHRTPELEDRSVYADRRLFKVPSDPRVTAFGRLLRRTSLDELPQLLDVLRGRMSLVGPRPPLPEEVTSYRPEHHCRFDRRPGITGPWQVSGRNRITDFEKIVRLERAYISGWSLTKDFGILLRTIPAVVEGDGAE